MLANYCCYVLQNANCCPASNSMSAVNACLFAPSFSFSAVDLGPWLCRAVLPQLTCLLLPLEHMLYNTVKSQVASFGKGDSLWDHLNLQAKCRITQNLHKQLEYRLTLGKPNLFFFFNILENVSEVTFCKIPCCSHSTACSPMRPHSCIFPQTFSKMIQHWLSSLSKRWKKKILHI